MKQKKSLSPDLLYYIVWKITFFIWVVCVCVCVHVFVSISSMQLAMSVVLSFYLAAFMFASTLIRCSLWFRRRLCCDGEMQTGRLIRSSSLIFCRWSTKQAKKNSITTTTTKQITSGSSAPLALPVAFWCCCLAWFFMCFVLISVSISSMILRSRVFSLSDFRSLRYFSG